MLLRLRISRLPLHAVRVSVTALLVLVFGSLLLPASPGLAHNSLESSVPSNGETLSEAPLTWTLTFSATVPLRSASGQMITVTGSRIDLPDPRHGTSDRAIVFDLPASPDTPAVLRWRLVSDDGHVISGRVSITVVASSPPTSSSTTTPTTPDVGSVPTMPPGTAPSESVDADDVGQETARMDHLSIIGFVARFSGYAAVLGLGGLVFTEHAVARGTLLLRRSRTLFRWLLAALVIAPLAQLLVLTARVDGTALLTAVPSVPDVAVTSTGATHVVRLGLALLLVCVAWREPSAVRTERATSGTFGLIAIGYLAAIAYGGHSRTGGSAWLGIPTSVVHLIAAAAWLGGLATLRVVLLPQLSATQSVQTMARFSRLAPSAVAVVAVTGVVQTVRLHEGLGSLTNTDHGRLLVLKLGLVAGLLVVGARARRQVRATTLIHMADVEALRARLRTVVNVDALIGIAIVGSTAALVASPYIR